MEWGSGPLARGCWSVHRGAFVEGGLLACISISDVRAVTLAAY